MNLVLVVSLATLSLLAGTESAPFDIELLNEKELGKLQKKETTEKGSKDGEGKKVKKEISKELKETQLLKKEHKLQGDPLQEIINRIFSSETASAVDGVFSSLVGLAGGVVEDLGELVVDSVEGLPDTIRRVSRVVGDAVDLKREKVFIMVKGVRPEMDSEQLALEASERISTSFADSRLQDSLQRLEESIGALIGKLIGITYQNADDISDAINNGVKRITGRTLDEMRSRSNKRTTDEVKTKIKRPQKEELAEVFSVKDNEIKIAKPQV